MADNSIRIEIPGIPQFDCTEAASLGPRWTRWLRSFEMYAEGKGIKDKGQQRALLLHSAGMAVQDIFFTLPAGEGDDAHAKCVDALNKHFKPQANVAFERHVFRKTTQNANETIEQFVTRLRFCHRSDCRYGFEKNISCCTVSYTALLMKTD